MATFDECFSNFPKLTGRPRDLESYWKKQVLRLRKVSHKVESRRIVSKKILTENQFQLRFQSVGGVEIEASIIAPKRFRRKPPVVVSIGHYHEHHSEPNHSLIDAGIAHVTFRLRGHEKLQELSQVTEDQKPATLGYFSGELTKKEDYYLNLIFLDTLRLVEVLRSRKEIDASRIGLWGRGTGCAAALFVSTCLRKTSGLFLEHPAFFHLELTQNLSRAEYAHEINAYLKQHRKQQAQVKTNLSYFDGLFFARQVKSPVAMVLNLKNANMVPQGGFAAFHHMTTEKDMHIYTLDDAKSLKEEVSGTQKTAVEFFRVNLAG